jgi:hypothetical protein
MGVNAPLMALGGAFGRLAGEIINDTMPGEVVSPAAYAISGAAAIVGGVTQVRYRALSRSTFFKKRSEFLFRRLCRPQF